MANPTVIPIRDFCGEPPYSLAKNEALRLLQHLDTVIEDRSKELRLDFQRVEAISASGARILAYGLLRRLGSNGLGRLVWTSVDETLRHRLEDAMSDAIEDLPHQAQQRC